jgi:hypothetical protein
MPRVIPATKEYAQHLDEQANLREARPKTASARLPLFSEEPIRLSRA